MKYYKERILLTTYTSFGAALISVAILHATYTQIFPLITEFSIILLFVPAFANGVINIEFKDSLFAMFVSMILTIILNTLLRSLPAFIGIITESVIFFIIAQLALSLPLIFPLVLVNILGTMAGLIFNEFVIEPRTKDLI